jgi:hypothetical protein
MTEARDNPEEPEEIRGTPCPPPRDLQEFEQRLADEPSGVRIAGGTRRAALRTTGPDGTPRRLTPGEIASFIEPDER